MPHKRFMEIVLILASLVFFHYLFDFPLQGDYLSRAKNQADPLPHTPWNHAMTAHCFLQAGGVYIVLGIWWIAALEFVSHFIIDSMKCHGELTYRQDQYLHIGCKVIWVILAIVTVTI